MTKKFNFNLKNKQIVILVGGYGKRLGKLTENISKPMIRINKIPFLVYLINYLKKQGFKKFLLLAGYKGNELKKEIKENFFKDNLKIEYYIERKPMGTGYVLKKAKSKLDNNFFLINGDTFTDLNFKDFIKNINLNKLINICVTKRKNNESGNFYVKNHKVNFIEKPYKSSGLINCGIYFLKKPITNFVTIKKNSFEKNLIPQTISLNQINLINKKINIFDIGSLKGIKEFTRYISN